MQGRNYGYRLKKKPNRSRFEIVAVQFDGDSTSKLISASENFLSAPYGFLDGPIAPEFKTGDFVVTEVKEQEHDGRRAVRLNWTRTRMKWDGWFLFAPDQSWAVLEYGWTPAGKKNFKGGSFEYGDKVQSMPILKLAQYWEASEPGRRAVQSTYEFSDVAPASPPDSEFTLTAFDLPEPPGLPERNTGWPTYVWALIVAGVCAVIVVAIRIRKSRQ